MITIFNRRSLYVGNDVGRRNEILDILEANHMDYKTKQTGNQNRTRGAWGQNVNELVTYEVFVSQKDYEQCRYLIRSK